METRHWNYVHGAKLVFQQMDRVRQWHGLLMESAGFAPKETPFRVVHKERGLTLRCYSDASEDGPPILIAPAPIKRSYIWDLAPDVSVVRRCLEQGMRVYLAEWTQIDGAGKNFGLAEYADRLLSSCLDAIEADTGGQPVTLAGHSLGGTLTAIFACLYPERVRSLVLLEAPLHFGEDAGRFAPMVAATPDTGFFEDNFDCVPGSFLNALCVSSAPFEFQWERMMDISSACSRHPETLATHLRVERWMHDEFPLPARLFTEVVELLYRNDRLMQGDLRIGGREVGVGPLDLDVPLLSVLDPRSTVIPPQSVLPFHHAAAGSPKKLLEYNGDVGVCIQHVGVLVGTNAHAHVWPEIFDWLPEAGSVH